MAGLPLLPGPLAVKEEESPMPELVVVAAGDLELDGEPECVGGEVGDMTAKG